MPNLTDNLLIDTANQSAEALVNVGIEGLKIADKGVRAIDNAVSLRSLGGVLTKHLPEHKVLDTSFGDVRSAAVQKAEEFHPAAGFAAEVALPNVVDVVGGAGYIRKGFKAVKHGISLTPDILKIVRRSADDLLSPKLVTAGGPAMPSRLAISTAEQFGKANPLMIQGTKQVATKIATSGKARRLAIKASEDKPFYPELKPHRSYKTTSKLETVEDYKQAWKDWPDKSEAGRDKFYKEKGHWITEENFKLKPSPVKQTPDEKAAGIKRFGEELSDRSDYGVWTRKQRGDILTYMSGEVPVSTKTASYKDPITGHNIIPHHRTSHGELAPWVDVIINKLNSPNPKIKAEGKQMMEIGKAVFNKAKIKVGDTYKNYEGYFHEAHLGPGSIHDRLTQHKITGPSSRSAFDFTKGQNPLSKGILHKGKRIPTKDYIRMLPWKPAGNTGEFGDNTFWTTLVDYIQFSNMPRQTARKGVLSEFGRQGKNWAKGAR